MLATPTGSGVIRTTCPKCGREDAVADYLASLPILCSGCGTRVTIGEPIQTRSLFPPPPPPKVVVPPPPPPPKVVPPPPPPAAFIPPESVAEPLVDLADTSPPSVPLAVSKLPPPKPPAAPKLNWIDPKDGLPAPPPPAEAPFPLPLASAGRRILARLLFLVGLAVAAGVGFAVLVFAPKSVTRDPMMTWLLLAVPPVIYLMVNAAMLARSGQDVGKRYLGVRVVNADGSKATEKTALLKRDALTFLIGLTGVGLVYWLIDAFTLFSKGGRTLHDRIAGTRVVRG